MASPFENLIGPGKSLQPEPFDAKEYDGRLLSGVVRFSLIAILSVIDR